MSKNTISAAATGLPSPTRRGFGRSIAVTIAATALPPVVVAAAGNPDAELMRLGEVFTRQTAPIRECAAECNALYEVAGPQIEAAKRRVVVRAARAGLSEKETDRLIWEEVCKVRDRTGLEAAVERQNDAFDAREMTSKAIREMPAHSLAGLAVKAMVVGHECFSIDQLSAPDSDMDWDVRCFVNLVREIERMASALDYGRSTT